MKNSFYIRKEYLRIRLLDGRISEEPKLQFSWAKIGKDKYAVILPQFFKKAAGDVLIIVSGKKFLKLIDGLNLEAK